MQKVNHSKPDYSHHDRTDRTGLKLTSRRWLFHIGAFIDLVNRGFASAASIFTVGEATPTCRQEGTLSAVSNASNPRETQSYNLTLPIARSALKTRPMATTPIRRNLVKSSMADVL